MFENYNKFNINKLCTSILNNLDKLISKSNICFILYYFLIYSETIYNYQLLKFLKKIDLTDILYKFYSNSLITELIEYPFFKNKYKLELYNKNIKTKLLRINNIINIIKS